MAEEKETNQTIGIHDTDNLLCVGSWNVHNWCDAKANRNLERVIKALNETPVDVIGLQEAMKYVHKGDKTEALQKFVGELDFKELSTKGLYQGVVMASKYKIIQSFHISNRLQLNVIKYKQMLIAIIVVHFNYRDEKVRIKEYSQLAEVIKEYSSQLPLLLIGDFNALTQSDYDYKEWQRITRIRKENQWEPPQTLLMQLITSKNNFHDLLYLFGHSRKECTGNIHSDHKQKKEANGSRWINVLGGRNLGTCAYDTRIDYVLINDKMIKLFDIVQYEHLSHGDASDHKLVRVTSKLI